MTFLVSAFGCGLRLVDLNAVDVVKIEQDSAPINSIEHSKQWIKTCNKLAGTTQIMSYDRLLWRVTRLPFIRSTSGELVLLDTGMTDPIRVTLDIINEGGHPVRPGESANLTYVKSLAIGQVAVNRILAAIETQQWQLHVLGLPLYRMRGWALGLPLLGQTNFIAFNNQTAEVTFGFEKFESWPQLSWQSYELINRDGMLYVSLPIAGVPTQLCADSAGGPRIILNREQWEAISKHVKIKRHWATSYPTWGRSQKVDAYRVR